LPSASLISATGGGGFSIVGAKRRIPAAQTVETIAFVPNRDHGVFGRQRIAEKTMANRRAGTRAAGSDVQQPFGFAVMVRL
jgi:hypothetical protein